MVCHAHSHECSREALAEGRGLWCVNSLFSLSVCKPPAARRGCVCSKATNPQAQLQKVTDLPDRWERQGLGISLWLQLPSADPSDKTLGFSTPPLAAHGLQPAALP